MSCKGDALQQLRALLCELPPAVVAHTKLRCRYGMEESEGAECIICLSDPKEASPHFSPHVSL